MQAAERQNLDNVVARATRLESEASVDSQLGAAAPSVGLQGKYTRNQRDIVFPAGSTGKILPISPHNQWDGQVDVHVPIINLGVFAGVRAARIVAHAAGMQQDATVLQVETQVAQSYYTLVANMAMRDAAERALSVAQESLKLTEERGRAGTAASLDVNRAKAALEVQVQHKAEAELQVALAARDLQSLTQTTPDLSSAAPLFDDLHAEDPLNTFVPDDLLLPSLAAAIENRRAHDEEVNVRKRQLLPTLGLQFTERLTNATALNGGHYDVWMAMALLRWDFDYSLLANLDLAAAHISAARAQEDKARQGAHDAIHAAWQRVLANIAQSRSARAQAEVSDEAATLAQDRYKVGVATQLDLLQAQRDAFAADVNRIQADANLVLGRVRLRLAAGRRYQQFADERTGTTAAQAQGVEQVAPATPPEDSPTSGGDHNAPPAQEMK